VVDKQEKKRPAIPHLYKAVAGPRCDSSSNGVGHSTKALGLAISSSTRGAKQAENGLQKTTTEYEYILI